MKKSIDFPLSVVVIGRNEGQRLSTCLKSINEMKFSKPFEVIYVDSLSTDESVKVASVFGARVVEMKSVLLSAAAARNLGWKAACGEIILFLDGDTILHPDFVERSFSKFYDPAIAVVFGNRNELFPNYSMYNFVHDIEWNSQKQKARYCGGDALISKRVLEKVEGYNNALIAGEEPEMCSRIKSLGFSIIYLDIPMTMHDISMTSFKQYFKRCFRTGSAYASMIYHVDGLDLLYWKKISRHNLVKGFVLSVLLLILFFSLLLLNPLPIFCVGLFILSMCFYSAFRARKRCGSLCKCLLYGLHSQIQHFPMFLGQLYYWIQVITRKAPKIIEYK